MSLEDRQSNADVGEIKRLWRMQLEFKRILIEARYDTYWMKIQSSRGYKNSLRLSDIHFRGNSKTYLEKQQDVRTGGDIISFVFYFRIKYYITI